MDLAIFATPEAWISLITLMFLEIVLGVDNLVFIAITSNRLPENKQHIGRRLGLAGALLMRIILLCFASFLIHLTAPLFTINLGVYVHDFSFRDILLFLGGVYLVYLGINELREMLGLKDIKAEDEAADSNEAQGTRALTLPRAVATIMAMDVVLSVDSVITAVGLANHLIIMVIAVMLAVILMMVFIDWISEFVKKYPEMTILALCFIATIGILLMLDSAGITSGIEVMDMHAEKLMVYFAMAFAVIIVCVQIRYKNNLRKYRAQRKTERDQTSDPSLEPGSKSDVSKVEGSTSNPNTAPETSKALKNDDTEF